MNYGNRTTINPTGVTDADINMQNISGWIDAIADFGTFYAGGTVAYVFVSYANADKKPTAAWRNNAYGCEVNLTATYK